MNTRNADFLLMYKEVHVNVKEHSGTLWYTLRKFLASKFRMTIAIR